MDSNKYYVSGMMCNGCKHHVQSTLNDFPEVTKAKVDLKASSVDIQFSHTIDFSAFKAAFEAKAEDYLLFETEEEFIQAKKKV